MSATDVAVIGGGPAGLAAAAAAAEAGARVTLVDENAQLGGQYWRQPPPEFGPTTPHGDGAQGRALIDRVRALGVDLRLGTAVWGLFDEAGGLEGPQTPTRSEPPRRSRAGPRDRCRHRDGRTLALARGDEVERLQATAIVFATGAHDRPVPFPGWTLPGVMTAGGAQNLMKGYGVLPGRRVLIAGTGPLLLVVAHSLLAGGANVVAVAEAASMRGAWRWGPRLFRHPGLLRQGLGYLAGLRRAGVPLLRGHVIRRALGESEVTGATVSACDETWTPRPGTERRFDVDAVVVGYGFVPSDMARLAGCEYRWAPDIGGWVPVLRAAQSTTVPGVFVAGEAAGVAGAVVALEEGRLAGLASARHVGCLDGARFRALAAPVERRLRRLASFRRVMDEVYRAGPGLVALAEPDTIVCRCEELRAATVQTAIDDGARVVNEVKTYTRAGMGRCQGRLCGATVAAMIARSTGDSPAAAGTYTARMPVRPISLAALAGAADEHEHQEETR
ncbi:MAG: FAD-dependent oxidoreductase [Candidatus Rokubacteria bacterium]|nr:FAD-dependent oxidoreductase [Candidatus Rokubacteria bacterium]